MQTPCSERLSSSLRATFSPHHFDKSCPCSTGSIPPSWKSASERVNTSGSPGEQLCVTMPPLSSLRWSSSNITTNASTAAIKAAEFLFEDLPSLQSPVLRAGDRDGKWGGNLLGEELPCLCPRMTRLQLPQDCPRAHQCHLACFSQASSFC